MERKRAAPESPEKNASVAAIPALRPWGYLSAQTAAAIALPVLQGGGTDRTSRFASRRSSTLPMVSGAGQTGFQYHLQRRILDVDRVVLAAGIVYLTKAA